MSSHAHTITYADMEASLAAIGGVKGLLLMLPAMLSDLPETLLDTIEKGLVDELPIDITIDLPGLRYEVKLRGSSDAD